MSNVEHQIWAGVDVLLDHYVRVTAQDQVIIAYTQDSRDPAAWIATALRIRGLVPTTVAMRPMTDETFAQRLSEVMPKPDAIVRRLVIITVERESMSHTLLLRQALAPYDERRWLVARIISASPEFFTHSMNVRPEGLSALNTTLLRRFMAARELRIKTPSGTDIRVVLNSDKYRWISNRGKWRPGGFIMLPAGEVATYPVSVDGLLVADGAFNVNVPTKLDARLGEHPIKIRVKDGKAADFECVHPRTAELIALCLAQPFARNVGEIGFGTNGGIDQFVSMNSHINERRPGIHLGFGQHNQNFYTMEYWCDIHLDMIAQGGLVWVDDDPDPIDMKHVEPSICDHPTLTMDEDIDGDCCGLWRNEAHAECEELSDRTYQAPVTE